MPDIIQGYRTDVILEEDETEGAEGMAEESDYIIPESDSRYLSREELSGLSLQQLNYAKMKFMPEEADFSILRNCRTTLTASPGIVALLHQQILTVWLH